MSKLILIGIDHRGISPEHKRLIASSQALFTTQRFHELVKEYQGNIYPLAPVSEALISIERLLAQDCTVCMLASGDPLFYGIGQLLINRFGKECLEIYPALSSMQLAFARLKQSWQNAHIISLHGRNVLPESVLQHSTVFIFTDNTNTPAAIADQLLQRLYQDNAPNDGAGIQVYVFENLGMPDEHMTEGSLHRIATMTFSELNVMILLNPAPTKPSSRFGLSESAIQHSRGLITKDEVRAAIIHKLQLADTGVMWDVGAGSGSISIESARLFPSLTIYATERNADEQANITKNINTYGLHTISLIMGEAPGAFAGLPSPDRVFIGGSGGHLTTIISQVAQLLNSGGRVVISAVTDATREAAPKLLYEHGFTVEMTDIQVARRGYPENKTAKQHFNPITIITGQANDR